MRKIATMAEAYYIPVLPRRHRTHHNGRRRSSHDAPNFNRLEIAYSELAHYNTTLIPPQDAKNGFYKVPDTQGKGDEQNPDYIAAGPNKSIVT